MSKYFLFSSYIDEQKIDCNPEEITSNTKHRYSITIPFKDRTEEDGVHVVVIMKNPSGAGKPIQNGDRLQSDDTIYHVLDYLYKFKKDFTVYKVTILNLMSIYAPTFNKLIETSQSTNEFSNEENNLAFENVLNELRPQDIIIAAWGGEPKYPNKKKNIKKITYKITRDELKNFYLKRIEYTLDILKNYSVYRVGELTGDEFPKHGKMWRDYDPLTSYVPK